MTQPSRPGIGPALVALGLLSACSFNSSAELPADASGRDAPMLMEDAFGTGTDAANIDPGACYGPMGAFRVCLGGVPTGVITLPATIDTTPGAPGSLCLEAQPLDWAAAQPPACFIIADTILAGDTSVTGVWPLVLVAHQRIAITGTLDVASHVDGKRGPGATGDGCEPFARAAESTTKGAGGGAGGSFMTIGGSGGEGDKKADAGLPSPAETTSPTTLRGGCDGQTGGSGEQLAGLAGPAGGAVYLVAGTAIENAGAINASGAGGAAGGDNSGGSGGGTGGMIVLHAPMIDASEGTVIANGGGGAGGGTKNRDGLAGADPDVAALATPAPGGNGSGAVGGAGFADGRDATSGAKGGKDKGGGGGGGGAGYIRANVVFTGEKSPQPEVVP